MATSGTTDYRMTLAQIVESAALKVGALREGATLSAESDTRIKRDLSGMIKAWQASGIHVWTTREGVLVPAAAVGRYTLGSGGTARVADGDDFFQTSLSAAEAAGQTVLSITSTANFANSDKIGVILDDGTVHWSTVSSFTSTTVTIPDALASAAASGNAVFTYTDLIPKPLGIAEARRQSVADLTETPLTVYSRREYTDIPNKTGAGQTSILWYDPGRDTGVIKTWPVQATVVDLIRFTWRKPIEDWNTNAQYGDFPQEWALAIVFNLAQLLCAEWPVSEPRYQRIVQNAGAYLDLVMGHDREPESIFFGVDLEG